MDLCRVCIMKYFLSSWEKCTSDGNSGNITTDYRYVDTFLGKISGEFQVTIPLFR